jgi:hypothetical protein
LPRELLYVRDSFVVVASLRPGATTIGMYAFAVPVNLETLTETPEEAPLSALLSLSPEDAAFTCAAYTSRPSVPANSAESNSK